MKKIRVAIDTDNQIVLLEQRDIIFLSTVNMNHSLKYYFTGSYALFFRRMFIVPVVIKTLLRRYGK